METTGKFQTFDLKLKALGPVFIGDGTKTGKKEYLHDRQRGLASFFDGEKFFRLLLEKGLEDKYEAFMYGGQGDLHAFLTCGCGLREEDWAPALRCSLKIGDDLDAARSANDIFGFVRDAGSRAYIPGSSVKGALRTVLLQQLILKDGGKKDLEFSPRDRNGRIPEERYLHRLKLKSRAADMVNSIMRGVRLSDSLPLDETELCIVSKWDWSIGGRMRRINLFRECIRPGTELRLKLGLDQSVLKGAVTAESLRAAIDEFDEYYLRTYLSYFSVPRGMVDVDFENCIFLGGGTGFFSKSLLYPYLGERQGLEKTARLMAGEFKGHYHERDVEKGISPHTVKYARYEGMFYPMGLCGVEIE